MKTRRSTGFSSSKSWHVDEVCVCPTPGGEPLYHVPYEFALFASTFDAAKKRVNKRLPRMTHRFAALSVRRKRTPKTQGKWIAPRRSREPPDLTRFGWIGVETNAARVAGYAPKRLARRSLLESKRLGEVWLPSRRWSIARLNCP
jgi:hypothetical protein